MYDCHNSYSAWLATQRTHAVSALTSVRDGKTNFTLFWTLKYFFHLAPSLYGHSNRLKKIEYLGYISILVKSNTSCPLEISRSLCHNSKAFYIGGMFHCLPMKLPAPLGQENGKTFKGI